LRAWLDQQIAASGGEPGDAYRRANRDLGKISDLVELARVRMTLNRAIDTAARDCPFWVSPERDFRGRQILDDRWLFTFGGGGKGIIVSQGDRTDLNFGGAGRLLFGRAIGPRWTLMLGVEGGASASFPRDDGGDRGSLVLGLDLVTPIAARYRMVNSYVEAEVGFLTVLRETDAADPEPGVHIGFSIGGSASRRRWFLPGSALGVSYERTFPDGGDDPLQMLKFGLRAAIDIDL
jgi:hypothetical protein